jgi:hypothetical protein
MAQVINNIRTCLDIDGIGTWIQLSVAPVLDGKIRHVGQGLELDGAFIVYILV